MCCLMEAYQLENTLNLYLRVKNLIGFFKVYGDSQYFFSLETHSLHILLLCAKNFTENVCKIGPLE